MSNSLRTVDLKYTPPWTKDFFVDIPKQQKTFIMPCHAIRQHNLQNFAMASTGLRIASLVSIFVVLCSIYYQRTDRSLSRLSDVLAGLQRAEGGLKKLSDTKRIVIGYGACKDVFTSAADLFEFAESSKEPGELHTLKDLQETFTYFFRHGAAAERFLSNSTVYKELVERAQAKNPRYAVGGNAPIMALRFAEAGFSVQLAAKMTPSLSKDFSNKITVIGPSIEVDDVHLILEYKTGDKWGPYTAPRANRFIVHNDNNNPTISSAEAALGKFKKFNPILLVIGGLQMMDSFPFPPGERKKRLEVVQKQMRDMGENVHIHFEMASYSQFDLLQDVIDNILPFADSLGMNEQELANLMSMLEFGNITTVADSNPRVAIVLDDMRRVFAEMTSLSANRPGHRQLTRIHVHTLAYQTIMTVKDSSWALTAKAAAKASLTANRHVCNSHEVDIEKARLILDSSFAASRANGSRRIEVKEDQPISCWEEPSPVGLVEICVAPNLVCTQAEQTCGGGDNISASALGVQI